MPQNESPITLRTAELVAVVGLLSVSACGGGLPRDYERLPLDKQWQAYAHQIHRYGHPLLHARAAIAEHGFAAADMAAHCIDAKSCDLPLPEALGIIHLVQTGGCQLQGTKAEAPVRKLATDLPTDSADGLLARITLEAIEHDYVSPTWHARDCPLRPSRGATSPIPTTQRSPT